MKHKISITIEKELHLKMKELALKRDVYVSDLYEELIENYLRKFTNQKTLDE